MGMIRNLGSALKLCRFSNVSRSSGNTIHTSSHAQVDKVLLAKLRKQTGFTLSNCKKALELHSEDLEKASVWLKDEAQKQGWANASKLFNRHTPQGLIGLHLTHNSATLVEVNCETDFVAKNEYFRSFAQSVAKSCNIDSVVEEIKKETFTRKNLESLPAEGHTLLDEAALCIGKLGENVIVNRGSSISVPEGVQLYGYMHPSTPGSPSFLGTVGAVVAVENTDVDPSVLREVCGHIAGCNPKSVGKKEEPSEADEESPKKKKKRKTSEEKQDVMYYQKMLSNDSITVGQFLEENNVKVIDFIRFQLGETIEQES